jgi:hypothetical protein
MGATTNRIEGADESRIQATCPSSISVPSRTDAGVFTTLDTAWVTNSSCTPSCQLLLDRVEAFDSPGRHHQDVVDGAEHGVAADDRVHVRDRAHEAGGAREIGRRG